MKIQKQLKEDWLKALKSGEYVQGTSQFKTEKEGYSVKHCCLGVLCEVSGKNISKNAFDDDYAYVEGLLGIDDISPNSIDTDVSFLMMTNDNDCDGKFTAVIPLIEAIETYD